MVCFLLKIFSRKYIRKYLFFLESGSTLKAANAAIRAKLWNKALEILKILDSMSSECAELYTRIAQHYEAESQYEVK